MKRTLTILLSAALALLVLAGCGGGSSSSTPSSAAPSSSAPSSAPGSTSAGDSSVDASATATPGYDLDGILVTLSEAANLGTTINVSELDLKAGGITTDNLARFVGAESQLSAENGGIVLLLQAKDADKAAQLLTELEAFKASRMGNEDYAEFENARTNTENARIKAFGNYVVYAVSATGVDGGWDALDAAIDAAFAE